MGESGTELPLAGSSFVLSVLSLIVVSALAVLLLRWLGRRGGGGGGAIQIRGRCYLEPRRSLYVVETAGRCFLIGVSDGPVSLIAEIDGTALPAFFVGRADGVGFVGRLRSLLRRRS